MGKCSSRAHNISARATSHPGRVRQAALAISEVKSQTIASAHYGDGKVRDTRPECRREHLRITHLVAVIEENVVAQVGQASNLPRSKTDCKTVVCENPHLALKFLQEEEL